MANLLTAARLCLALPLVWLIARPEAASGWWLLALLLIAIASDYFDGPIARRRGTASARGMLFDHGSDFLFVSSGLAAAASIGLLTPLLPLLIALAFSQYVLDSYWLHRLKQLRMSFLGRWNGIFYFVPLLLIALDRLLTTDLTTLIAALAWLLAASSIASIVDRALAPRRGG